MNGREYTAYHADLGTIGGKRVRIGASSRDECESRVAKWYKQYGVSGDTLVQLSRTEAADAVLAFGALKNANCQKSLVSIVEEYLRQSGGGIVQTKLTDAYDRYYARFTDDQTTSRELVQRRVGKFVAVFHAKMVHEITTDMVKHYLAGLGSLSPKTWNNQMLYIRGFFNWCAKKVNRYCLENPCADMEKQTQRYKAPECAKVEAVRALFGTLLKSDHKERDAILFRLTASFFCGMRSSEIKRLDVSDVRLEDGSILVRAPKGSQSGRASYRTFPIPPTAAAWFGICDLAKVASFRYTESAMLKYISRMKQTSGEDFPINSGRHSFISYHVAAYGNPHATEGIVGTSEDMRKSNYQTLATKADGEAYFAITPDSF